MEFCITKRINKKNVNEKLKKICGIAFFSFDVSGYIEGAKVSKEESGRASEIERV